MTARASLAVFATTLFLSASLMFSVQPMAGKMLLPLVGGTPAGWIVAMAFFQIMLLAGYLLAHGLSLLPARQHGLLYVLGLCAGMVFLPVTLAGLDTHSGVPEAGRIFMLLTQALAVPFIILSATSSTLQRLFMNTGHPAAQDPYFLYAASNLGSFSGLLLYPLLVEPQLALSQQTNAFSAGYALLIAFAAACLYLARGAKKAAPGAAKPAGAKAGWRRQLEWLALAFIPSCLLMSVTTYITSDVISAPFVWILPLAFYLLTFVVAFSRKPVVSLARMEAIHPYVVCLGMLVISIIGAKWLYTWTGVGFYLLVFTLVTLACHMRLASLRPVNEERQLTSFYLMMSLGGALGGVLNAFIIPVVLNRLIEFPLTLLASFLIHRDFRISSPRGTAIAGLLLASLLLVNAPHFDLGIDLVEGRRWLLQGVCLAIAFTLIFRRRAMQADALMLGTIIVFMISQYIIADRNEILSVRNFYGTIRLYDETKRVEGREQTIRVMRHGSTTHGMQIQSDPALAMEPTTYFTRKGPVGDVFNYIEPKSVAILGLGTGSMNCFNAPDRSFMFFEIDPEVAAVARRDFTFLTDCKSKTPPRVLIGDGRLELAKLDGKYDLLIMDVFTSDSIPAHLLTREALQLYKDHLAPGGVIAMNISNRYFALWNVIAATAAPLGLRAEIKPDTGPERPSYSTPSIWLVLSAKDGDRSLASRGWKTVVPKDSVRPWTDDYTSLVGTLSRDVAAQSAEVK